jgi:hypothetical protein
MKEIVARNVAEMNRGFVSAESMPVAENEFEKLPAPVRKYIDFTGFRGKGNIQTARMKLRGMFRTGVNANWMPFTAEQYMNLNSLSFIWYAQMRGPMGIKFGAMDEYLNGEGHMLVKLANLFTIADARGSEINQGEMVRFLSELMLIPPALTRKFIQWEPVDDLSAKASLSIKNAQISGLFEFDEEGRITNFTAKRYRSAGKYYFLEDWSTPVGNYKEIDDHWLPADVEAIWNLNIGELTYIKSELVSIEYDVPGIY